jgi:RHS repeat-associated protein
MLTGLARRPILSSLLIAACLGAGAGGAIATGQQEAAPEAGRSSGSPHGPVPGQEIVSERTRSSNTFAAENGAVRSRFYADDVNFKDGGGDWQKIDSTLTASDQEGYAFGNAANSWAVDLPGRLETKPVRVEEDGEWVSFALDGATAGGSAAGNEAVYRDAFEGVDVEYSITGSSVKETLSLASADARSSYSFTVEASDGLSARSAGGGIAFVDQAGRTRFSFAPPYMEDAAGQLSEDVRFELSRDGAGWDVGLVADREWIEARGRRFPVRIDPTTMLHSDLTMDADGTQAECHIVSGSPSTSFCANEGMRAGQYSGVKYRALMRWDYIHDQIKRDSLVLDAKLKLFVNWIDGGNSADWAVHSLSKVFTTGATWNKRNGVHDWTTPGGDFAAGASATKTIANTTGWHTWRVTDLVQEWADTTSTNHGLLLKQVGETTSNRLHISHTDGGELMPQLEILYTPRGGSQPQYTFHEERLTDRSGLAVNVANGNLVVHGSDVHIPGTAGHDLDVVRSYNSVPGGWQGFGAWEMNTGADVELQELENGDVVFWGPNAQVAVFRKDGATYKQPTGLDATLTKNGDGTYEIRFFKSEEKLFFTAARKLDKHVDRNGNELRFTYTTDGYLQKITDSQDRDTTFAVAGTGRKMVTSITDPAGRVHSYSYPNGYLTTYTDPAGGVTNYTYETTGQTDRLKQIEDPEGNLTKFTYLTGCLEWQEPCRVAKIERMRVESPAAYDVTTFAYIAGDAPCPDATDAGEPEVTGHTIVTDARGNATTGDSTDGKTTYCYDREMRVVWTKDQEGHITKQKYTANSNVTRYTNGNAAQTEAEYGASNRLKSTVKPKSGTNENGATTTFGYEDREDSHFPSSMVDPQEKRWNYTYTSKSNVSTIRQGVEEPGADVPEVHVNYNDGGSGDVANDGTVRWTKDGNLNRTDYGYDSAGNLTSITPPTGSGQGPIEIIYTTSLSRVASITDGKDQRREFVYDDVDRVTQVKFYDASDQLVRTNSYVYDDNGNRTSRTDAYGTTTWTIDPKNRTTEESRPGLATALYSYDRNDNLESFTHVGKQVTYTYTGDNLVETIQEPGVTGAITYSYDDDDNRENVSYPNGVTETADFDDADRPTSLLVQKGTNTALVNLEYDWVTLNGEGETTERDLVRTVTDNRDSATTTFDYDDVGRVVDANTTGGRTHRWRYSYDNASNRTQKIEGANTYTSYAYDSGNELCWRHASNVSNPQCDSPPSGAVTSEFDANGNMTSSTTGFSASYNALNQSATLGSTTMGYAAEGQAERTSKGTTSFGWSLLGLSSEKTGTSTTHYVRDNTGSLLSQELPAGTRSYYHRDALGSVLSMSASGTGAEQNRYIYEDPYGQEITTTGTTTNPWQFAGEYADTSDRYKIGERYYVPSLGRWTQKDPLNQALSARESNGFVYAGADPVNIADPNGMIWGIELGEDCPPFNPDCHTDDGAVNWDSDDVLDALRCAPGLIFKRPICIPDENPTDLFW